MALKFKDYTFYASGHRVENLVSVWGEEHAKFEHSSNLNKCINLTISE